MRGRRRRTGMSVFSALIRRKPDGARTQDGADDPRPCALESRLNEEHSLFFLSDMNSKRLFRKTPGWKIEGLSDLPDEVSVLQSEVALADLA
jgi:hypothetical protein